VAKVDQRGFDNPRSAAFLDGRAAAAFLGVKRETLYAYASRGLVRSEPGPAGRGRRYAREDLVRLKARHDARSGHGPVAAGALHWGEPILETKVGTIDRRGPIYRGVPALELVRGERSFEATAELLWSGALAEADPTWPKPKGRAPSWPRIPAEARPVEALAIACALLATRDHRRFEATTRLDQARALIAELAAAAGLASAPALAKRAREQDSIAGRLAAALGADSRSAADAVNLALVLLADHELNASSFAVRVAASTGAHLYAAVSAGLAALSGPRHGGAVERVEALADEVGSPARAREIIDARIRRGDDVPGFGHTLYPGGDPRAAPLLDAARALAPKNAMVRTILALDAAMRDAGRPPMTVDVGLAALGAALGLPRGSAAAIFAIGRTAGWIAHADEQRAAAFLLRPRARYTGP
jgi:citrate synthase